MKTKKMDKGRENSKDECFLPSVKQQKNLA